MTMARQISALARRVRGFFAECNYAQRRLTMVKMGPGRVPSPRGPRRRTITPSSMFRTSGMLLREPDARHRAHGRFVG